MKIYLLLLLGIYLEGIVSNFNLFSSSLFIPLFSLMSLLLIYPYMKLDNSKYYLISFLFGIFYDILYTNTLFLHGFLFFICSIIIVRIFKYLPHHLLSVLGNATITIILFRTISYLLLVMLRYINHDFKVLFQSIITSLLINMFYVLFIYILLEYPILKKIPRRRKRRSKMI